jgi:hypothetical protein
MKVLISILETSSPVNGGITFGLMKGMAIAICSGSVRTQVLLPDLEICKQCRSVCYAM